MSKDKSKGKARVSKLAAASSKAGAENDQQPLFPEARKYHVRFVQCFSPEPVAGKSWEGIRVDMVGAGKDKKLGEVAQLYATSQKALAQSAPRLRSLCRSLVGLAKNDDDTFTTFDPNGEFQDAIYNNEMDAAAEYMVEHAKALPKALRAKDEAAALERLTTCDLEAVVSKGSDTDDGDWYRNTSFRPIDVEAEEETDEEDDEDEAPESEPTPKSGKRGKAKPAVDEDDEDDEDEAEEEDESDDDSDDEDEDEAPESEPAPKAKKKAKRK